MREELRLELSELCDGNPGVRKLMLHFSISEDVAFTSISDLAAIVGKDPADPAVREVADELLRYFSDQLDLGSYEEVDESPDINFCNNKIDWDISTSSLGHFFSGLVDEIDPISEELRKQQETEEDESEEDESEEDESEEDESEVPARMSVYELPLREDLNVEVIIPDDMTLEEAARFCKHFLAIAADDLEA